MAEKTELGFGKSYPPGFALGSVPVLFVALFCMGVQSAFFGPVALLPQHVAEEEFIAANALVEAATFIAIVVGTLLAILGTVSWSSVPPTPGQLKLGFAAG